MKLAGKRALVTGSDQGIGQAIALRLAEEGADVAINYRKNREGADQTRGQIEKLGRRAATVQAGVGIAADAQRAVSACFAHEFQRPARRSPALANFRPGHVSG